VEELKWSERKNGVKWDKTGHKKVTSAKLVTEYKQKTHTGHLSLVQFLALTIGLSYMLNPSHKWWQASCRVSQHGGGALLEQYKSKHFRSIFRTCLLLKTLQICSKFSSYMKWNNSWKIKLLVFLSPSSRNVLWKISTSNEKVRWFSVHNFL
jgi:hypothetical protein